MRVIRVVQEDQINGLISKDKRIDGRKLDEFRKIEIEKNPIENAEGSARVRIGKTDVIVGVKLGVGEPFPDKQNEGILITSAELSPIASPNFEKGPPREDSVELARVVDRGIRESKMIDMEKLCIKEGEKVWMVFVDIEIVNHDGNLIDASAMGATAALLNAQMPEYDGKKIDTEKKTGKLPITCKPIAVTFKKINGKLIVDPAAEEEIVRGARITVTTNEKGNVCAIQKGESTPMTVEEIQQALDTSVKKGNEIRKVL